MVLNYVDFVKSVQYSHEEEENLTLFVIQSDNSPIKKMHESEEKYIPVQNFIDNVDKNDKRK